MKSLGIMAAMTSMASSFFGMPSTERRSPARIYRAAPQTEASKKWHKERAVAKRERKGLINRARVARGEMGYTDAYLVRSGFGDATPDPVLDDLPALSLNTRCYDDMTVAELLDLGRSMGLKVTTKMTKNTLIETIKSA